MKKVLLTTTAMAFAASMASAGDMSMSGAIKLTYGGFGTGTSQVLTDDFTSEADLDRCNKCWRKHFYVRYSRA